VSNYRVALTSSAEKELSALPAKVVERIIPRLECIANAPGLPGCKNLKGGDNKWRPAQSM
jgi:mRNA-degrading endonuclease RelE of RelBE toxin-antitoxin system